MKYDEGVLYNIMLSPEDRSGDTILEENVSDEQLDERLDYWDEQYPTGHVYFQIPGKYYNPFD